MPLPTPNEGEAKNDFVSRCMSSTAKEFPDQKQRAAVCNSQFKKKESKDSVIRENVKFRWSEEFKISESTQDKDRIKITGPLMRETTSRNGRTYTLEEIQKAKITGQTISVNHSEDVTDNVGTLLVHPVEEGLDFTAEVQNTGYHPAIVEMVRDGLVKYTSIEAIAEEMVKEGDNVIAKGLDITGLGLVKTPGIPEMTVAIAEAFNDEESDSKEEETPEIEEKGDKMTETQEKPQEEKQEETKEEPEVKEEPKESTESLIDKSIEKITKEFESKETALKEEIDVLKQNIKKLQEQPTKGKVTEKSDVLELTKVENKDGTHDFYSEKLLY